MCAMIKNIIIISRAACPQRLELIYLPSVSYSHTVQSRSLQNLQASRVLHVSESPFSAEDESEPLHRHPPGDRGLEDFIAMMGKLRVNEEQSMSLNSSQEEGMGHFHVDPITGHIATLTLDPQRSARLRPHADDMWKKQINYPYMNSPNHPPPDNRAGNYLGLLFTQTGKLGFNRSSFVFHIYFVCMPFSLFVTLFYISIWIWILHWNCLSRWTLSPLPPGFDKMPVQMSLETIELWWCVQFWSQWIICKMLKDFVFIEELIGSVWINSGIKHKLKTKQKSFQIHFLC